jgi:hypothetical protein
MEKKKERDEFWKGHGSWMVANPFWRDEWMTGWMDEWINKWMHGWIDGWINK